MIGMEDMHRGKSDGSPKSRELYSETYEFTEAIDIVKSVDANSNNNNQKNEPGIVGTEKQNVFEMKRKPTIYDSREMAWKQRIHMFFENPKSSRWVSKIEL